MSYICNKHSFLLMPMVFQTSNLHFRNIFIVHLQFIVHFQLLHFIKNSDAKYKQFDGTVLQISFKKCFHSACFLKLHFSGNYYTNVISLSDVLQYVALLTNTWQQGTIKEMMAHVEVVRCLKFSDILWKQLDSEWHISFT